MRFRCSFFGGLSGHRLLMVSTTCSTGDKSRTSRLSPGQVLAPISIKPHLDNKAIRKWLRGYLPAGAVPELNRVYAITNMRLGVFGPYLRMGEAISGMHGKSIVKLDAHTIVAICYSKLAYFRRYSRESTGWRVTAPIPRVAWARVRSAFSILNAVPPNESQHARLVKEAGKLSRRTFVA